MEVLGEGIKAIGEAVGSLAFWWAIVQVVKTVAISYLISECDVPFDKVSDFFKRPNKKGF